MPVAVTANSAKSVRQGVSVRHDGGLVIAARHRVPQAAQPSATRPWISPRATRGPMSWSAGTQRNLPGKHLAGDLDLAGPGSLPLPGPLAGARIAPRRCILVFLANSSCQGLVSVEQS